MQDININSKKTTEYSFGSGHFLHTWKNHNEIISLFYKQKTGFFALVQSTQQLIENSFDLYNILDITQMTLSQSMRNIFAKNRQTIHLSFHKIRQHVQQHIYPIVCRDNANEQQISVRWIDRGLKGGSEEELKNTQNYVYWSASPKTDQVENKIKEQLYDINIFKVECVAFQKIRTQKYKKKKEQSVASKLSETLQQQKQDDSQIEIYTKYQLTITPYANLEQINQTNNQENDKSIGYIVQHSLDQPQAYEVQMTQKYTSNLQQNQQDQIKDPQNTKIQNLIEYTKFSAKNPKSQAQDSSTDDENNLIIQFQCKNQNLNKIQQQQKDTFEIKIKNIGVAQQKEKQQQPVSKNKQNAPIQSNDQQDQLLNYEIKNLVIKTPIHIKQFMDRFSESFLNILTFLKNYYGLNKSDQILTVNDNYYLYSLAIYIYSNFNKIHKISYFERLQQTEKILTVQISLIESEYMDKIISKIAKVILWPSLTNEKNSIDKTQVNYEQSENKASVPKPEEHQHNKISKRIKKRNFLKQQNYIIGFSQSLRQKLLLHGYFYEENLSKQGPKYEVALEISEQKQFSHQIQSFQMINQLEINKITNTTLADQTIEYIVRKFNDLTYKIQEIQSKKKEIQVDSNREALDQDLLQSLQVQYDRLKEVLQQIINKYLEREAFCTPDDLEEIKPIAYVQDPSLYKSFLNAYLLDLDNDKILFPQKMSMLSHLIIAAVTNQRQFSNSKAYLNDDDILSCITVVKNKIDNLTISDKNENLIKSLDVLGTLLSAFTTIHGEGFRQEWKTELLNSVDKMSSIVEKIKNWFSNKAKDPRLEIKQKYIIRSVDYLKGVKAETLDDNYLKFFGSVCTFFAGGIFNPFSGGLIDSVMSVGGLIVQGLATFNVKKLSNNATKFIKYNQISAFLDYSIYDIEQNLFSKQNSSAQLSSNQKGGEDKDEKKYYLRKIYDIQPINIEKSKLLTVQAIELLVKIVCDPTRKIWEKKRAVMLLFYIALNAWPGDKFDRTGILALLKGKRKDKKKREDKRIARDLEIEIGKSHWNNSLDIQNYIVMCLNGLDRISLGHLNLQRKIKDVIKSINDLLKFTTAESIEIEMPKEPQQRQDFFLIALQENSLDLYALSMLDKASIELDENQSLTIKITIQCVNLEVYNEFENQKSQLKDSKNPQIIVDKIKEFQQDQTKFKKINKAQQNLINNKDLKDNLNKQKKNYLENILLPLLKKAINNTNWADITMAIDNIYDLNLRQFSRPIHQKIEQFVEGKQGKDKQQKSVLLIQGEAGTGKTVLMRDIERLYWSKFRQGLSMQIVPVYVPLSEISDYDQFVQETLKRQGIQEQIVVQLLSQGRRRKQNRFGTNRYQFLFLLDGYNELKTPLNLIQAKDIRYLDCKVIITTRTDQLKSIGDEYKKLFLRDQNFDSLKELLIPPLNQGQLIKYFNDLINLNLSQIGTADQNNQLTLNESRMISKWTNYYQYFEKIHEINLDMFINSPFMLKILSESLPRLIYDERQEDMEEDDLDIPDKKQNIGANLKQAKNPNNMKKRTTRAQLYEIFISQQINREASNLYKNKNLNVPEKYDIATSAKEYQKDLAIEMFLKQKTSVDSESVNYQLPKFMQQDKEFARFFNSEAPKIYLAYKASQIIDVDGQCRFSNISIMEFFVSQVFYRDLQIIANKTYFKEKSSNYRSLQNQSNSSAQASKQNYQEIEVKAKIKQILEGEYLYLSRWNNIAQETNVLDFLNDQIDQDENEYQENIQKQNSQKIYSNEQEISQNSRIPDQSSQNQIISINLNIRCQAIYQMIVYLVEDSIAIQAQKNLFHNLIIISIYQPQIFLKIREERIRQDQTNFTNKFMDYINEQEILDKIKRLKRAKDSQYYKLYEDLTNDNCIQKFFMRDEQFIFDFLLQLNHNTQKLVEIIKDKFQSLAGSENVITVKEYENIQKIIVESDWSALKYLSEESKKNKEIVKIAVKKNGEALLHADDSLKSDVDIVKIAVKTTGKALQHCSKGLQNNTDIVELALKQDGTLLQYASSELKKDEIIVGKAIEANNEAIKYADIELLEHKQDIIQDSVKQDGMALQYVPDKDILKNDQVVTTAVSNNGLALQFATEKQKSNPNIVLNAVRNNGLALEYATNLSIEVVMAAVKQNGLALMFARKYSQDQEVVREAVTQNAFSLQYADEYLQANQAIVEIAVSKDGRALQFASENLRNDQKIIIKAIKNNVEALDFASDKSKSKDDIIQILQSEQKEQQQNQLNLQKNKYEDYSFQKNIYVIVKLLYYKQQMDSQLISKFCNDKEIMLHLVDINGNNLQYASEALKKDEEVVQKAVMRNGEALQYANVKFYNKYNIIKRAVKNYGLALGIVTGDLKENQDILMSAVKNNGLALQYASKNLQDNENIVIQAVNNNGLALQYASKNLQDNQNIVMQAVKNNGLALQHASQNLISNENIVMQAVQNNGLALKHASQNLKSNEKIVKQAVQNNGLALQYASQNLRSNENIVTYAVKNNGKAIQFASLDLKKNKQIVLEAVSQNPEVLHIQQIFIDQEIKDVANNQLKILEEQQLQLQQQQQQQQQQEQEQQQVIQDQIENNYAKSFYNYQRFPIQPIDDGIFHYDPSQNENTSQYGQDLYRELKTSKINIFQQVQPQHMLPTQQQQQQQLLQQIIIDQEICDQESNYGISNLKSSIIIPNSNFQQNSILQQQQQQQQQQQIIDQQIYNQQSNYGIQNLKSSIIIPNSNLQQHLILQQQQQQQQIVQNQPIQSRESYQAIQSLKSSIVIPNAGPEQNLFLNEQPQQQPSPYKPHKSLLQSVQLTQEQLEQQLKQSQNMTFFAAVKKNN